MKLYEITDQLAQLDEVLETFGGELTPELEADLDRLEADLDQKVEQIACLIRNKLREADAVRLESVRLATRARSIDRAAGSLKDYLARCLDAAGRTKAGGPISGARIQANPPAARCSYDGINIPAGYRRETLSYAFDAQKALEDHKAGRELPPGVEIVRGRHVRLT